MPYGLCVVTGAVAGVISMAVLFHADTPRGTPMPIADMPQASSVAEPTVVTLQHNANVMFDNVRPEVQTRVEVPAGALGVNLPFGQRVRVTFIRMNSSATEWRAGELVACDAEWVQLRSSKGEDLLINRSAVQYMEVVSPTSNE